MKLYELTYLISPELSEEELKNLSKKISDFILEEEGTLKKTVELFRKKLGYVIKNKEEAFWATLNFHLNPEKIKNLREKLKPETQILRYMILTKKESKTSEKKVLPKTEKPPETIIESSQPTTQQPKTEKVELKEIDKKIEEILSE